MADDAVKIQDAEIVDSPASKISTAKDGSAQIVLSLEQMIKATVRTIAKQKEELKKYKEMLESALLNDETYRLHNDTAKAAAKVKGATKLQIMKQPANAQVAGKVKELSESVKDAETGLEDYLSEYSRMSGTNEIEDENGEIQEIVFVPRLVKKSSYQAKR